jgi:dTDP-4-amino-4,6-dideoxygalactose transaminase
MPCAAPRGADEPAEGTFDTMQVPFIDLSHQHEDLWPAYETALKEVFHRGAFVLGPAVAQFEEEFRRYLGVKHVVGVNSGTDALLLAIKSCGIGPGDEVITTPYTFVATVDTIVRAGARPVFVDIERHSFNMDPNHIEAVTTPNTKALLPVHLFGRVAAMDFLTAFAHQRRLLIIEDVAQACGAQFAGQMAGTFGNVGCFSFYPTKTLGGSGDGGAIATDNDEIADRVRRYRDHGRTTAGASTYDMIGFNSRLDSVQAALLRLKLPDLDESNADRVANAKLYNELLGEAPVQCPVIPEDGSHVVNYYTILCENRDQLRAYLQDQGIGTSIYYPVPMHLQPCHIYLGYRAGNFPVAEEVAQQALSLPCYPGLTKKAIETVAGAICAFYGVTV